MTKKFIRSTCLFLAAVVTISFCVMTTAAFGIDQATLDFYAANNIYFYDPTETGGCSGSVNIPGITPSIDSDVSEENGIYVTEKLIEAGYTPIAAAAIAGNITWESGFYPCKVEGNSNIGCDSLNSSIDANGNSYILGLTRSYDGGNAGFGLIQWTGDRKKNLINLAGSKGTKVTDLDTQIEELIHELATWGIKPSPTEELNNLANGPDGLIQATWRIYRYFETPATSFRWEGGSGDYYGTQNKQQPTDPLTLNETDHAGAYNEFYNHRIAAALYFLDLLNSMGYTNNTGSTSVTVSGSDISIVTDDTTSETLKNNLLAKFDGAEVIADLTSTRKYIIYAARVDDSISLDDIKAITDTIDNQKTIFFINSQVSSANAIREVAGSKDNVKLADYSSISEEEIINQVYDAIQSIANSESRKSESCTGTINGVTYKEIDGQIWAYPNAGVTKATYGPIGTMSNFYYKQNYDFSRADGYGGGAIHHDYAAVDIGKCDSPSGSFSPCRSTQGGDGINVSEDVPVVAFTDGTITTYKVYEFNGTRYEGCSSITFRGSDGALYWIGHSKYEEQYEALVDTEIKAGTQIGVIGPAYCGQGAAHTHIDERGCNGNGSGLPRDGYSCYQYEKAPNANGYSTHIVDVILQLYDELPEE